MNRLDQITLGDVGKTLGRYRPFIAVLTGILLVAVFLPGESSETSANTATELTNQGGGGSADLTTRGPSDGAPATTRPADQATSGSPASGVAGGSGSAGGETADTTGGDTSVGGVGGSAVEQPESTSGLNATCDPNTGHLAVPTNAPPPCVQTAPNTGNDYQGVTGDNIKVVYYIAQDDPAAQAILSAAGADSTEEEERQQAKDWLDYYSHHYETYGRNVELIFLKGSGEPSNDEAARADAVKVAEEIGAFASLNSPSNTYTKELAARGVMCIRCQVSQPIGNYHENAPYSWGMLMASTEGYVHRAEYVGKRLWQNGKKAELAGDPTMHLKNRKFGLLYYNNGGAYEDGAVFFENHLRDKWGVELTLRRDYVGFPQTHKSQEAARPLIQALKEAGVTSVLCACDPFAPVFFTQEATRQNYFPEWVITGSAFTDTTLFARTYDQQQWENAFGISFLTARVPEEITKELRILKWHFGQDYEPPAPTYGFIGDPFEIFFLGVHLAGPTLTPQTFKQGMFGMAPLGRGHIIQETMSYGQQLWSFDDYTTLDDITTLWWDRNATGEDETGAFGKGMYRYVDMGKRYLPDGQPDIPPKAFEKDNTVMVYDDYPEGDRPPEYEHE